MENADKEKFAVTLLKMINEKREEIKALTSEIMELENDPKNVVKIKQNIQCIVNAVASVSNSKSKYIEALQSSALAVLNLIRLSKNLGNPLRPIVVAGLENFCVLANSWNPIEYDFSKKGLKLDLKNVNIGVNINR
jgi:hypothetical protein